MNGAENDFKQIIHFYVKSRGEGEVEFFHERPKAFAKGTVDRAEDVVGFEVVAVHAAAGADVVAHLFQPREVVGAEGGAVGTFLCHPLIKSLVHMLLKWFEDGLLLEGETDEGDEIGEAADRIFLRGGLLADLEGVPEAGHGVEAELGLLFQLRFEFLQAFFGKPLFERAAVEDLQGLDLGAVLFDVVAEGAH